VSRVLTLRAAVAVLAIVIGAGTASAQDLEPRAYASSPVGSTFLVLGISRSTGSVVVDPTLPVSDIEAGINAAVVGLARTFKVGDRLVLGSFALPYTWGNVEGRVGEDARQVYRSGLADLRAKVSANLWGPPAMSTAEFVKTPPRTVAGASFTVAAPSGQYDPVKLINLGNNRWAFKPEVGVSHPIGRWDLDAYVGVWFFTDNDDYYPGTSQRSQSPIVATQGHVSYTFARRAWVAFDATYYAGGRSTVNGGEPSERQSNTRIGATLALPVGKRQSIKASFSTGAATRTGTDFNTVGVMWQTFWFH
jgi:outer membrane putative beta-barrel porin/alpha-amylase